MVMPVMIGMGKLDKQNPKFAKTVCQGPKMTILEVKMVDLESREERFLNILKTF